MTWQVELGAVVGASIVAAERTFGGSINEAYRVELSDGRSVFVKTHRAPPPGMYACEAQDLRALGHGPLRVPRVIGHGDAFLALEWLELAGRYADEDFGRGLAQLHARPQAAADGPHFGASTGNYLATLPQTGRAADIATLWTRHRLRPMFVRLADPSLLARLEALAARPHLFGPPEPPALVHGDLWSGNVDACGGAPVIFDPACYYGHREIDLAMLLLFGSLSSRFLDAYNEVRPLDDEWRSRVPLWQLYPLAVHAVLFGGGYGRQIDAAFDQLGL